VRGICRYYGDRLGCAGKADARYTMRFDDIGEEPIEWCANCGPAAHALNDALQKAFERPGFAAQLEAEIDKRRPQ